MVEYAIEQTVLRRINSNILFKYADAILRYWKENNVKTLEEGKAYDEAQRKKLLLQDRRLNIELKNLLNM